MSEHSPYSRFKGQQTILRDYLAIDRTILANERTFLSYIRTALAMVVVGVSAIKFFNSPLLEVLGWCFIALGLTTLLVGYWRYDRTRKRINVALEPQPQEKEQRDEELDKSEREVAVGQ